MNQKISMTNLANAAGVSVSMVSHIVAGRKECPPVLARIFESATGIPASEWRNVKGNPHIRGLFQTRTRGVRQTAEEKREYNRKLYQRKKAQNEW